MKKSVLLFVPLLLARLTFLGSISYSGDVTLRIPSHGSILHSVHSDYYSEWRQNYRVDTRFTDYLSNSTFNFNGFFDQIYSRFVRELETTIWGSEYTRPTLDYGNAKYNAGEPVSDLDTIATHVCSTISEIEMAFSSASSGDIIFIEAGTYVVASSLTLSEKSNVIIAGQGWNTVLKLNDGVNAPIIKGYHSDSIIVRDLMIDGNMASNPDYTDTYGIVMRFSTNLLVENVKSINARRMGINAHDGNFVYFINCVSINCGWNCIDHVRCSYGATIGNYMQDNRDVGYSTWGSDHLVVANNVAVGGTHDRKGFNDANWGIGLETQKGNNPFDTHTIVVRNNICCEHNAANETEPWKGVGIWVMGSGHASDNAGTYNIIVDGNVMQNNNRAGLVIADDSLYSDRSSTIVIIYNYASGNDVYNINGTNYGNYVIYRSGVVFANNTEE